jgi:hypothetical protein
MMYGLFRDPPDGENCDPSSTQMFNWHAENNDPVLQSGSPLRGTILTAKYFGLYAGYDSNHFNLNLNLNASRNFSGANHVRIFDRSGYFGSASDNGEHNYLRLVIGTASPSTSNTWNAGVLASDEGIPSIERFVSGIF